MTRRLPIRRLASAVAMSIVPQDRAAPRPVRSPKGIGAAWPASPNGAVASRPSRPGRDGCGRSPIGRPYTRRDGRPGRTQPLDADAEAIRLQAEEHPLIEDVPPATAAEHCLRLMHLRAYDEAVGHAIGRDVLDVGCNTGYGTLRFAPVARRVVGVDVSPRAIDAAQQRAPEGRPEFVLTSGLDLPFTDDSFDLVTSFQVLEHVPDPLAYLREIARVTRPGGTVILATPNAAIRLDPGMTPWNRFHVHEYLADELRELLLGVFARSRSSRDVRGPKLYETEIRRVDAARQRIRRKTKGPRRARRRSAKGGHAGRRGCRPPGGTGLAVADRAGVVARFLRAWLRSVVRPAAGRPAVARCGGETEPTSGGCGGAGQAMDLESFLRFSVADLFYADSDLDRAMDLLAICRSGGPRAGPWLAGVGDPVLLCHRPGRRPSDPMGM